MSETPNYTEFVTVKNVEGKGDGINIDTSKISNYDWTLYERTVDAFMQSNKEFGKNINDIVDLGNFDFRGDIDMTEAELDKYVANKIALMNKILNDFITNGEQDYSYVDGLVDSLKPSALKDEIKNIADGKGFQNDTVFGQFAAKIGAGYIKAGNTYWGRQKQRIDEIFENE